MMVNDQFGRWGVMGEQHNRSAVVKQKQIFDVLIDWYPPEKGGRRQIPQRGIYYCTTEILNKYKTDTWSIALKMNEISQHEAEMWFLFDHDERHVHIGQLFVLLEGPKCVGHIMIQRFKDSG